MLDRPGCHFATRPEAQLGQNVLYVRFDRAFPEHQRLGNFTVGVRPGDQTSDFSLPLGESAERSRARPARGR
jgi:hypothetical protein